MLAILLAALAAPLTTAAPHGCADPAITSATVHHVTSNGRLETYQVTITVGNLGTVAESPSLLQSVAIYRNGEKADQIGTSPLKPNASQTVHYSLQRSSEAGPGTTHLRLQLVFTSPHGVPISDCNIENDTYHLRF